MSGPAASAPTTEGLLLVAAALSTGLLAALERQRTPPELARDLDLDERALRAALAGLDELGVVARGPRGFRLTTFGRERFADREHPRHVGAGLPLWRASLRGWLFLDEVLRTGRPLPEDASRGALERLYDSLDAKPASRVEALVERVLARAAGAARVLDVGGGSGRHARAFLSRGCAAVTLLERPGVAALVRERFGLDRLTNLRLIAGDAREALPWGPFDVILLADVLHEMAPRDARALLLRAARRAAAGGVVAVVEPLLGRSRGAALQGVSLVLHSAEGRVYREEELRAWLAEAGLEEVEVNDLDAGLALVSGRRPPASRGSG